MKKFFRKLKKKLSPLLLIPIVFVAILLLVGGYFLFLAGDDSDETASKTPSAPANTDTGSDGETGKLEKPEGPKLEPDKPTGKEFTIDSDRDEKDYAVAQATGSIKTPARIAVRIGAAPKQPVAVNVDIVCLRASEGTKSSRATFSVTPPHTRDIAVPVDDAVSCTTTANAQLTQAGKGRIKVFLIGTRRAEG